MQFCQDNANSVYSCQEREKHYVYIAGSLCEQLQLFERLPPRHLVATHILGCATSIAEPYSMLHSHLAAKSQRLIHC